MSKLYVYPSSPWFIPLIIQMQFEIKQEEAAWLIMRPTLHTV